MSSFTSQMVGIEVFREPVFWHQLRELTTANLKSRYRKTIAGFVWVVMNPIILFAVQSAVFRMILKIQIPNYSVFLLCGLLPWIFLVQSLDMCVSIYLNAGKLLKAFPVHPLVYLLSQLVDNLINFLCAFGLILIPFWFLQTNHPVAILLLPIPLFLLLLGVFALCWILAITQIFFRDTKFMLAFVMQVCFFLTPIFYPRSFVPERFQWCVSINIFYYLIQPFSHLIYQFEPRLFFMTCAQSLGVGLTLLLIAATLWKKKRNAIYFSL